MKKRLILFLIPVLLLLTAATAQRKVSELTLVYDATVSTGDKEPKLADAFDGASTTVYIKEI